MKTTEAKKFENFITTRNDVVDNAVYDMLCTIANVSGQEEELDWDMEIIGEIADYAEEVLNGSEVETCRPFYEGENETPCYLGTDCKNPNCPLRKKEAWA